MSTLPWYKREISLFPVSAADVASLIKNLAVMLEAGMAPPEAFEVLTDQSHGTLKRVTTVVTQRLSGGQSLSDALAAQPRVFSALIQSAVQVGERSGTLSKNLTRVAHQIEQELAIRRDIQGALLLGLVAFLGMRLIHHAVVIARVMKLARKNQLQMLRKEQ
mgnify:CR=1 FL=1